MILWWAGKTILLGPLSRLPELTPLKLQLADLIAAAEFRDIPQQPKSDQARLDVLFHVNLLVPSF
jgi:hypothetical protein